MDEMGFAGEVPRLCEFCNWIFYSRTSTKGSRVLNCCPKCARNPWRRRLLEGRRQESRTTTHEPRAGYYCTDAYCPDCGSRHLDACEETGQVDPLCGPCYAEALRDVAERDARRAATAYVRAETLEGLARGLHAQGIELAHVIKRAVSTDDGNLRAAASRKVIEARRADPERIEALRYPRPHT